MGSRALAAVLVSFLENVWWIQLVFSDLREAPNDRLKLV